MEERKIIKFGKSSHVITLPNEWMNNNKLEKGDKVNISQMQNSLLVTLDEKIEKETVEIDIDAVPLKIFNKMLMGYYLKNYKFIKIKGKKVIERLEEIRVLKEKLSSVEIFEIGKDYVLLKDLSDPDKLDVTNLIERIVEIEKLLFNEVIENNRHRYIAQVDSNINKLTFLTFKTINYNLEKKHKIDEVKNSIYSWRIVGSFERIGDIIKRISRYIGNGDKSNRGLVDLLVIVRDYYEFVTGLLGKDINLTNNLKVYLDKKQSLLKELEESRDKFGDNVSQYLLIVQLLKDLIGNLETVTISIMDINLH